MRYFFMIFLFAIIISSCTKNVPETEKKIATSVDEKNAGETILNFATAFNENNIEKAVSFFDLDYKGVVSDSDDLAGIDALRNDLDHIRQLYPDGKLEVSIDEGNTSADFAYFICTSSYMATDIIEKKLSPVYSEKSIKILRKGKEGSWKIYRSVSTPIFTYDQK